MPPRGCVVDTTVMDLDLQIDFTVENQALTLAFWVFIVVVVVLAADDRF